MRSLSELLTEPKGAAYLEERGIFLDEAAFSERLAPPARPELTDHLGLTRDVRLVYVGQQVCSDMGAATAAKFASARELGKDGHGVAPVVLWHDMDSTQSERFGARVVLPSQKRARGLWLAPRDLEDLEPRFIPVRRERLEAVINDMRGWVDQFRNDDRASARERVDRLAEALLGEDIETLADANRALATLLLREELGFDPPATSASDMLADGLLIDSVSEYIARIDEVVAVFNGAVEGLVAAEIDPQVRPLPDDYLPLRFSCPEDGGRVRLVSERRGEDLHAVADCRCGARHEFNLGNGPPDLGELVETGRWSIDVSMPVHHNALASGWVGGRSTALYGLVFNEVLEKALGQQPIPVLVPRDLGQDEDADTLLVRYLVNAPVAAGAAH